MLQSCFENNALDNLIHTKYKHSPIGYYNSFVSNRLFIGKTYRLIDSQVEPCNILDDDHCPSCNQTGFITKNNKIDDDIAAPDCGVCSKIICQLCSAYNAHEYSYICHQCDTSSLKENINKKLSNYKSMDNTRFGIQGNVTFDDIVALLKKQQFNCYVCDEMVLTTKWKPFCCYQFTLDRIDNTLPHNRNNVLISCYYCNCRNHPEFTQDYKICAARCHSMKKDHLPLRYHIDKNKINNLLLT